MVTKSFTIEQMLQAAEQANLPNYNGTFIDYDLHTDERPVQACVIGEAFLNLGFVENGIQAGNLSDALRAIPIDIPFITEPKEVKLTYGHMIETLYPEMVSDLSGFINELNSLKGYSGKKRIPALVRKHFASQLGTIIEYNEDGFEVVS